MLVRYKGDTFGFGVDALTNNKVYECVGIEPPFLRIIDDSEEDYLYDILTPRNLNSEAQGVWEIIEDDENNSLKKAIEDYTHVDFGTWITKK